MGLFHGAAGALFAISWFVFADGAWFASNRNGTAFTFVECLPGIFSVVALIMLLFVDMKSIQGQETDDMFGGGGGGMPEDVMRHKILFFFAAMVFLAGLTVAVWQEAAKYKNSDNWWPGLALTLQVVCMMGSSFCFGASKMARPQADDGF